MIGLGKCIAFIVGTIIGLAIFTQYHGGDSVTHLAGYPLISASQVGARGWIAFGQGDARGVIVFAQVGFGLICFAQAGVGVLFGVGQAMAGLLAIGQAGLGLLLFLGMMGFGYQAAGLGVAFGRAEGYFSEMNAEFKCLLSFRPAKED